MAYFAANGRFPIGCGIPAEDVDIVLLSFHFDAAEKDHSLRMAYGDRKHYAERDMRVPTCGPRRCGRNNITMHSPISAKEICFLAFCAALQF